MNYKLEISINDGLLEMLYYDPSKNKQSGYGMVVTVEDMTMEILEDFVVDARQFEADTEAQKN